MKSIAFLTAAIAMMISLNSCCSLPRSTVQGGTGEPHMGQIPTMKVLAPDPNS